MSIPDNWTTKPIPAKATHGRWFPVLLLRYNSHEPFWDRDAGLYFEGFKANGIDTRFVALGEPSSADNDRLILAPQRQMEDAGWWKQWRLEGVVLYSWGLPKFTGVARAIHQAGIRLVVLMDTDGVMPHLWFWRHLEVKYHYAKARRSLLPALSALGRTLAALPRFRYQGIIEHLEFADVIALPSPIAKQRCARFLLSMNRPDLVKRLAMVYYPVSTAINYDPNVPKQKEIVAVGGWDRLVKGGDLLIEVLGQVFSRDPEYHARVIGSGEQRLRELVQKLPAAVRNRIEVVGPVAHNQIAKDYQRPQICLNTSTSESFGIACAEALCCGCTVVGNAQIGSMVHFCSVGSGTVAASRTLGNYTDAVLAEIETWRAGERDPVQISRIWTSKLHSDRVAASVITLASKQADGHGAAGPQPM